MKSVPMTAYPRTATRRGGVKVLRAAGRVPAVIYGRLNAPENLELIARDLETLIHGAVSENILVDLTVVGDSKGQRLALLQEVQHHPLVGNVLHVDLHEVSENETVTVLVPVETTGEPVGVKTGGGTLEHVLFRIKVRTLPKNLPEALVLDVSQLEVGKSIHLGDIKPPAGVEIMGDRKLTVVSVAAPLTEAAEAAATDAAGATAQPEMIKEKKDAAAAPAAGDKKAGDKKPADKKK